MENVGTAPSPTTSAPSAPSAPVNAGTGGGQSPTQAPSKSTHSAPAKAQPATSAPEYFEFTANGKPVKMTRQELIDNASKAHAADQRFNDASKLRKQVDQIISTAKTNPIKALMDPALGLTKDQIKAAFEDWYTNEYIEPETLTPEQKRLKDTEARLKAYEDQEKEMKAQQEAEQLDRLTAQQRDHYQKTIIEAMEESGLPKTKFIAGRMAFYVRQNMMNGWDAPMSLIVSQVKKERQSLMSDMVETATPEQLIETLGESIVNKIRQHDLKQLRARRGGGQSNNGGVGPMVPESTEKVYMSDVTKNLRKMRNGNWGG